jgi:hypothetical protein
MSILPKVIIKKLKIWKTAQKFKPLKFSGQSIKR